MVLIIDDDQAVREAVMVILEMAGFAVLAAENGREGVAMYTRNQANIKAVLLDLTMPVMGGEQAMLEILQQDPDAKIILSSGHYEEDLAEKFGQSQPAGFLQKPFDLQDLVKKVTQVIN